MWIHSSTATSLIRKDPPDIIVSRRNVVCNGSLTWTQVYASSATTTLHTPSTQLTPLPICACKYWQASLHLCIPYRICLSLEGGAVLELPGHQASIPERLPPPPAAAAAGKGRVGGGLTPVLYTMPVWLKGNASWCQFHAVLTSINRSMLYSSQS